MKKKPDVCDGCGKPRRAYERWFYIYPDIAPKKQPVPISRFCARCGAVLGLARGKAAS